jgi:hypothetical protein
MRRVSTPAALDGEAFGADHRFARNEDELRQRLAEEEARGSIVPSRTTPAGTTTRRTCTLRG